MGCTASDDSIVASNDNYPPTSPKVFFDVSIGGSPAGNIYLFIFIPLS